MLPKNARSADLSQFETFEPTVATAPPKPARNEPDAPKSFLMKPRSLPVSGVETTVHVLRALVWLGCIVWVGIVLLFWLMKIPTEDSAIRDAASSASACLGVIAAYVVCRAIDSMTRR